MRESISNKHVNKKGLLPVGDGHEIYFEDWGNSEASPIFYIHGGPGANFSEQNKLLFDPLKHHVIFHDQRGCGRSIPYASTDHNTTRDLIGDISKLSDHLNIDSFIIVGGSWGSGLSLLYAIANPQRVRKILIWSVYLARQFENDYVNEGYPRYNFPEAWSRFISLVPKEHQKNGDMIMEYYAKKIRSEKTSEAKKFADEWTLWESSLISIHYDKASLEAEVLNENNMSTAMLETHYFLNKCFIPENYILDNIHKIKHITCYAVQGRFDFCTPPISALNLATQYGKNLTLKWTNAGHLRTDPENFATIKSILDTSLAKGART